MSAKRLRGESGASLAELLVTITILGLALTFIVGGFGQVSLASDHHRKQVNNDTVVRSYAEAIKKRVAMGLYVKCAGTSSYPTPNWTAPTGYTTSITSVTYWRSSTSTYTGGTCSSDEGAQMLNLKSVSADGRGTETLSIVVRTP